jgi:FKBP-type peptidyl-prolyl cis-trans isomerase
MKKIITTVILAAVVVSCNKTGGNSADKLENDDQKAAYAFGVMMGQEAERYSQSLGADSLNYDEVKKGLLDYINKAGEKNSYAYGQQLGMQISSVVKGQKLEGKLDNQVILQGLMSYLKKDSLLFNKDSIRSFLNDYAQNNFERIKTENAEKGTAFIEKMKKDSNVKATESGLLYQVVKEGTGETPNDNSIVEVNYVGKTSDGKEFDSSEKGKPAKFPLKNVIAGWQEGLKLMKIGSKYKFYIPGNLAYGEQGSRDGKIGPNEALEFEVELVSMEEAPAVPQGQQPQLTPEQMEALQKQIQQQQGR